MNNLIRLSEISSRLDVLLQGIKTTDLSAPDRQSVIRQAVRELSHDFPYREVLEFAGSDNSYYLLYGLAEDVDEAGRDAGIDLATTGAGAKLGIKFTLDYRMDIHQVGLWLSRTGATVDGTIDVAIYTQSANLPDKLIARSIAIDIDEPEGAPQGRYARVRFPFAAGNIFELDAGTYWAVLESEGYTYADGTTEVLLGVDQSSPAANTVATYNGTTLTWSAYGTPSAGILEVIASVPGWRQSGCAIESVEYPAADLANDEEPQMLEEEDYRIFRSKQGVWLYFPNASPSASEQVRLTYTRPYAWLESDDPLIDIAEEHFEAVTVMAASIACLLLAVRYSQNTGSTITADVVDRRTQADVLRSLAKDFKATYKSLTGSDEGETKPGQVITDVDYGYEVGSDFLFHRKSTR
jgi:hypothetical protein